jgi:hypothetical protein
VVCVASGPDACPATDRSALFDRWARSAIRRPGSTFAVWVAETGAGPKVAFTACIPERWGGGVLEAKAAFLREGRRRAGAGGAAFPEGCATNDDTAGSVVILDAGRRRPLAPEPEPRHVEVVCDRSDSMLGTACDVSALQAAFDAWLARSGGAAGSSFTIHGVDTTRDGASRLFHVAAPPVSAGERVARLVAARERLGASLDGAPTGSAIAEALSVAATELRGASGRRELLVLSDLRQVTPRVWNFEATAPEPSVFAAWFGSTGLAADLRGVEARACGLHHRRAPGARPFDAVLAKRVERAWSKAFEVAGATEARLQADCTFEGSPGGRS